MDLWTFAVLFNLVVGIFNLTVSLLSENETPQLLVCSFISFISFIVMWVLLALK